MIMLLKSGKVCLKDTIHEVLFFVPLTIHGEEIQNKRPKRKGPSSDL